MLPIAFSCAFVYAQSPQPGKAFRDCSACPELVTIPAGSLSVGTREDQIKDTERVEPPHTVAIPRALAVGRFEVTKAEFARFVNETGYSASGSCFVWTGQGYRQDPAKDWRDPDFMQKANEPVVCVNWDDAQAYAAWLARKTGKAYRLPTEQEWEYAARAGNIGLWPWGEDEDRACAYANIADASTKRGVPGTGGWRFHDCDDGHAYTAAVGGYRPNAFGLYDTTGNVWEWTEDCVLEEDRAPLTKGGEKPPNGCAQRVVRGGSWVDSPLFVRYDFRFRINPQDRDVYIGFRVVRPQ